MHVKRAKHAKANIDQKDTGHDINRYILALRYNIILIILSIYYPNKLTWTKCCTRVTRIQNDQQRDVVKYSTAWTTENFRLCFKG